MVVGTLYMFSSEACVLIGLGAAHFFISYKFVVHVDVTLVPLDYNI